MNFETARKIATITLAGDRDVVLARNRVAEAMRECGSSDFMQTRFVTAVSEVVRNALNHAGGGVLTVYVMADGCHVGIECRDQGPGIADVDAAMVDGFSTRRGSMGRGLGGAKRLSRDFIIESSQEHGTRVRMTGICKRQ